MATFQHLDRLLGTTPADLVRLIAAIDAARADTRRHLHAGHGRLDHLAAETRIRSTTASNAIEGIIATRERIEAIVADADQPRDRTEAEIAGYRDALDLILNAPPEAMPLTTGVILQLHRTLDSGIPGRHGHFKNADNTVEETLPDGTTRVRFEPVPAWRTPEAIDELQAGYATAIARGAIHPLLLIGAYILDFLVIHPFPDGNGRMARLLTLKLLLDQGYDIGRYVSLEHTIAAEREAYYDALGASTTGWHDDDHDPNPWLRYLCGTVLLPAYKELEQRLATLLEPGGRGKALDRFLEETETPDFAIDDIRRAVPDATDATIRARLADWRRRDLIVTVTQGRYARYRRVRRPSEAASG